MILEEGISLPDGLRVTVTVDQEAQPAPAEIPQEALAQRHALGKQMQAFGQRLVGRHLHLGDLIIEGREELEDRV